MIGLSDFRARSSHTKFVVVFEPVSTALGDSFREELEMLSSTQCLKYFLWLQRLISELNGSNTKIVIVFEAVLKTVDW